MNIFSCIYMPSAYHFSLSCIGEGNGNPLQCSCLENPRDREAWWAAVYGIAQSWTRLKRLSSSSSSLSSLQKCLFNCLSHSKNFWFFVFLLLILDDTIYTLETVNYILALAVITCHLPLQRWKHMLLQLLISSTTWEELSVESTNEVLCARGKNRQDRSSDRYFQELILWAQFLYLLTFRKALKSFMVITIPRD